MIYILLDESWYFDIGSAGSSTLVLQTVVPILWFSPTPVKVAVRGGTHNPLSPSFDFFQRSFCPLLPIQVNCRLEKFGFYPEGGGRVVADIPFPEKRTQTPFSLLNRGDFLSKNGLALIAEGKNLKDVEKIKEETHSTLSAFQKYLELEEKIESKILDNVQCKKGGIKVFESIIEYKNVCEIISMYPDPKKVPNETIAKQCAEEALNYIKNSDAPVDEHLADQLLLPLVLINGGEFRAVSISSNSEHFLTNASIIEQFFGKKCVEFKKLDDGSFHVIVLPGLKI